MHHRRKDVEVASVMIVMFRGQASLCEKVPTEAPELIETCFLLGREEPEEPTSPSDNNKGHLILLFIF